MTIRSVISVLVLSCVVVIRVPTASSAEQSPEPTETKITVGDQDLVLAAPAPFVDASGAIPSHFSILKEAVPATDLLLAWLIPKDVLTDWPNSADKPRRELKVGTSRAAASAHYTEREFAEVRKHLVSELPSVAALTDAVVAELTSTPQLADLPPMGLQRSLGVLGEDDRQVTFGMVFFKGTPDTGVETILSVASYVLVKTKVLVLTATSPEASEGEVRELARIAASWRELLWERNKP